MPDIDKLLSISSIFDVSTDCLLGGEEEIRPLNMKKLFDEDCGVAVNELPVNETIKKGVETITFTVKEGESQEEAKKRYYSNMINSREATITKLLDRCHNVSSMAQAFSKDKLREYTKETRQFVLPLLKDAKSIYPELTNTFFIIKYHICSVIDSIELVMNLYEK